MRIPTQFESQETEFENVCRAFFIEHCIIFVVSLAADYYVRKKQKFDMTRELELICILAYLFTTIILAWRLMDA